MANNEKHSPIELRFIEVFKGNSLKDACEKAGENYHNVRNWLKRRGKIPSEFLIKFANMTIYSVNWFLTGEGEKYIKNSGQINFDDLLENKIRAIVEEEFAKRKIRRKGAPSFTIGDTTETQSEEKVA